MNAQPLLFLGDKRRRALLARAVDNARRWRLSWTKSGENFEAQCEPPAEGGYAEPVASISTSCWALEIAGVRQAVLLLPHAASLWAVHETGINALDAAAMAAPGTIAEELEEEVATTLFRDLCAIDQLEAISVTRVPGDTLADWSRDCRAWSLQLRAATSGRAFTLLVSAQRFEMLAPARAVLPSAALVTRREAVGANSLSLSAVVGEVEMSVSELADVAVDDVLVLDQHLADPVSLLASHSSLPVAVGHLGRAGARRAIKISSIAASRN